MKETVLRIIDREGPQGLIINRAIYGKFTDKDKYVARLFSWPSFK
jgi:hypothetical protein